MNAEAPAKETLATLGTDPANIQGRVKNVASVRGRPFRKGNSGRRKGSKNKVHKADYAEAKTQALRLVPEVWARYRVHADTCLAAAGVGDCQMCRHYNDLIMHYAYGKPPQRQELVMAGLRADTAALTKAMGGTEADAKAAVAEVERRYAELKAAQ